MNVGLDVVDEVELVDHFGQFGHGVGQDIAFVEVVDEVVDLEDGGVGAAVDGDGRVEEAAVVAGDIDEAAVLRAAGRLLGRGGGLLLLGGFLLLDGLRLLVGLLLRLGLGGGRLGVVVVIVAAPDEGEAGCADAGARAGAEQGSAAHPVAAHALPVVAFAHGGSFRDPEGAVKRRGSFG